MRQLDAWTARGHLRPLVSRSYPLAEAAEALRALELAHRSRPHRAAAARGRRRMSAGARGTAWLIRGARPMFGDPPLTQELGYGATYSKANTRRICAMSRALALTRTTPCSRHE